MDTSTDTTIVSHTPGPWRVEDVGIDDSIAIMSGPAAEYRWLATASPDPSRGIDWDQTQANARLIAAAPELLRELKELMALVAAEYPQQQRVWLANALAAIAKAEGRE